MVSKTDEIPTAVPKAAEPHREETQEGASIIKKKESCGCGRAFQVLLRKVHHAFGSARNPTSWHTVSVAVPERCPYDDLLLIAELQALADCLHQRQPLDSCDERSPLLPGGWKTNDSLTCDSPVDPDNPVTLDHSDYPDIILSSSAASTLSRSERLGCGQGHKLALDTSEEDSMAYSNSGEQKQTVFSLDLGVTLESTSPGSIKPILQIGSAETDTEQQDGGTGCRSPRDKALGSHKPPGLCVEKYGSGEHEDSCTCYAHPPSVDSAHVGCSSVSMIHAVLCSPSAKPSPPQGMKADSTKDILNRLRVWPPGIAPDRRLETFDSGVGSPGHSADMSVMNGDGAPHHAEEQNGGGDPEHSDEGNEQEVIVIQDTGFTVKIQAPGTEPFDLQVSPQEMVQEIHQVLMDREDTCHRTCFSLQLEGNVLDNFAELKSLEGLQEGSLLKVVEEPYTVREARIHVRHIRDLLKSLDPSDSYNGVDCNSLSFLSVFTEGDLGENGNRKKKGSELEQIDCTPPEHILPGSKDRPLVPLQPQNKDWKLQLNRLPFDFAENGKRKKKGSELEQIDCTPPEHILPGSKDRPLVPLQPQNKDWKPLQCLKILTMSGWNPPPGNRKMHGDLMYLYMVTVEERHVSITASTRGFYLNQSTTYTFNPKPANPSFLSHSLVELLSQISPAFKKNFSTIQKKRVQRHPFERIATPFQVYSWTAPQVDHAMDCVRAEDAYTSRLGYEEHIPGQTRDWNEELQTTRELPRKNLPERLLRERAIFKVHSDFAAAATRGSMAVIDGNVMAINPGEETRMQMFIWNNIFFSLGFDVRDHYLELGGDSAAHAAPTNDLNGVRAYGAVDVDGLYTLGTVVVDYRGYRITAQSIIPGILEREQEQSVIYGSIDFGKTVVSHPKYLELLEKTSRPLKVQSHPVLDDKSEAVELCSSVECKGIIGNDGRHYILDLLRTFPPDLNFLPVEGEELPEESRRQGFPRQHRHRLACLRQELIEAFVEHRYLLFMKMAALQLMQQKANKESKATAALTENGGPQAATLENKGEGIDATATTNGSAPPSPMATENEACESPESSEGKAGEENIPGLAQAKELAETVAAEDGTADPKSREVVQNACKAVGSISNTSFDIRFNPDIFSPGVRFPEGSSEDIQKQKQLLKDAAAFLVSCQIPSLVSVRTHDGVRFPEGSSEDIQKQKQLLKDAAAFLVSCQIPSLVKDCLDHNALPMDGATLTEALHQHGINVRYLGTVLDFISKTPARTQLDHIYRIGIYELITRSAKHFFKTYLQGVELSGLSAAVSHFLNCFLSSFTDAVAHLPADELVSKRKNRRRRNRVAGGGGGDNTAWASLTPTELWRSIVSEASSYYHFTLHW
ncbi:UNVERIFIED_CONTAM: hypothetical protein FKN15_023977 [Acipenser sinensis]